MSENEDEFLSRCFLSDLLDLDRLEGGRDVLAILVHLRLLIATRGK